VSQCRTHSAYASLQLVGAPTAEFEKLIVVVIRKATRNELYISRTDRVNAHSL
jgi:hypothetical protein